MFKVENNRFTIIPIEALSLVIEHKEDGTLHIVGCPDDITLEESVNAVRQKVHSTLVDYQAGRDAVVKQWKRFQATKEFLEVDELSYLNKIWGDFDVDKYVSTRNSLLDSLNKSLFEITDFMLEHGITLLKLDKADGSPEVQVSLEQVNNLLDGLSKKS